MEAIIAVGVVVIVALVVRRSLAGEDEFGDAVGSMRLLHSVETGTLYVDIDVDNANDSPVSVSVRSRAASFLSALFPTARRVAGVDRSAFEPLGAVDGRETREWRFPIDEAPLGAVRVTLLIDQVGGRTRAISRTFRVADAMYIAVTKTEAISQVALAR